MAAAAVEDLPSDAEMGVSFSRGPIAVVPPAAQGGASFSWDVGP